MNVRMLATNDRVSATRNGRRGRCHSFQQTGLEGAHLQRCSGLGGSQKLPVSVGEPGSCRVMRVLPDDPERHQ